LSLDSQTYEIYINAFQACKNSHVYLPDFYTNPEAKGLVLGNNSNNNQINIANKANKRPPLADFEAFACYRPWEDFTCLELGALGTQETDQAYD
jgi:hypothetical protein